MMARMVTLALMRERKVHKKKKMILHFRMSCRREHSPQSEAESLDGEGKEGRSAQRRQETTEGTTQSAIAEADLLVKEAEATAYPD